MRIALFALFVLTCNTAQGADGPALLPGGITDAEEKTGYFYSKLGGVDAVDLATGKLRWTNAEVSRPLLVIDDRLLALSPQCDRVMLLDRSDGKRLKQSDAFDYPMEIRPAGGGDPLNPWSFAAAARKTKDGCYLLWQARRPPSPPSGRPVTPEQLKKLYEVFQGAFRLDLDRGKVESLKVEQLPRELQELFRDDDRTLLTFRPDRDVRKRFRELGLDRLQIRGIYYSNLDAVNVLPMGECLAALLVGATGKEDALKLVKWDLATGKQQPDDITLMTGSTEKLVHIRPRLSLDNRYLFVADPLSEKAKEYTIIETGTGKRLAQWSSGWFEEAAVVGPRVIMLLEGPSDRPFKVNGPGVHYPRTVRCMDLNSGRTHWEHPNLPRYQPPQLMVP